VLGGWSPMRMRWSVGTAFTRSPPNSSLEHMCHIVSDEELLWPCVTGHAMPSLVVTV